MLFGLINIFRGWGFVLRPGHLESTVSVKPLHIFLETFGPIDPPAMFL